MVALSDSQYKHLLLLLLLVGSSSSDTYFSLSLSLSVFSIRVCRDSVRGCRYNLFSLDLLSELLAPSRRRVMRFYIHILGAWYSDFILRIAFEALDAA